MPETELKFQADPSKKRGTLLVTAAFCLALGVGWDFVRGAPFPSPDTLLGLGLAALGIATYAYRQGVRALSISEGGIRLESAHGGKTLRLSWNDLVSVAIERRASGPIWTFVTRAGKKVRWAQSGFDNDQRLELERALLTAIGQHGIPIKG